MRTKQARKPPDHHRIISGRSTGTIFKISRCCYSFTSLRLLLFRSLFNAVVLHFLPCCAVFIIVVLFHQVVVVLFWGEQQQLLLFTHFRGCLFGLLVVKKAMFCHDQRNAPELRFGIMSGVFDPPEAVIISTRSCDHLVDVIFS